MAEPDGIGLPFHAEYTRLTKKCKKCNQPIPRDELTLLAGALSIRSGGVIYHPYHFSCFFERKGLDRLPQNVYQIANFESIRWSDQQNIRAKLNEIAATDENKPPGAAVKRKHPGDDSGDDTFSIGYSSGYGTPCPLCHLVIAQGDLRILKGDEHPKMDSERFHLECFAKTRVIKRFLGPGYQLKGFNSLSTSDQCKVIAAMPGKALVDVTNSSTVVNPPEVIKKGEEFSNALMRQKQLQNEKLFYFRDHLKNLSRPQLVALLAQNGQPEPPSSVDILDILADQMAFGGILRCSSCRSGFPVFHSWLGYYCQTPVSQWAICGAVHLVPIRVLFMAPDDLKQQFPFLNECGPLQNRLFEKRVRPWHALIHKNWPIAEDTDKLSPQQSLITIDNDLVVDPGATNARYANVYRSDVDGTAYSASLSCTDILAGINSFLTIQVLKSDRYTPSKGKTQRYWLYKSGGIIGGHCWRTERSMPLEKAVKAFEMEFEKHTGNLWANRNDFKKLAGRKFFEPDYKHKPSRLKWPVRELIELLVDEKAMKKKARTVQLDLARMPLTRLSQKRIHDAATVLDAIYDAMINSPNGVNWPTMVTLTNHFYSLIPHNFRYEEFPKVLDSVDKIEKKFEMLETLDGIAFTYSLATHDHYPIDSFYQKLNVRLRPMSGSEPAFTYIERCAKAVHSFDKSIQFKLIQVFEVEKDSEKENFNPRRLHNRRLLWHGSSLTNYTSILSKGLMTAPINMYRNGDRFGRGIYFADYIDKAMNFCKVVKADPHVGRLDAVGLVLLCEVALGNVKNLLEVNRTLESPPRGYDSVRGIGLITPLRSDDNVFGDKELVVNEPDTCTTFVNETLLPSVFLYHTEYIVYDPAQVRMRYLVEFLNHRP